MSKTNACHYLVLFLVCLALRSQCTTAETDNWPRFRGPNGEGLSNANLPAQFTEKDYNWKIGLPGGGHSSPTVWGDRIFLTSGIPATGRRIVLCVKASDGATVWKREFDSTTCTQNSLNSYGSTTPALDKDYVFVCWATTKKYTLLALDHEGRDVWQIDLGPFASQHGHGASPIVFEDMVVLANDQDGEGFLIAVDRRTGEKRWQVKRRAGKAAYATPCVFQPEGGAAQLIFEGSEHGVTSVDPRSGKVNWEVADAFPKRVVSSPVAGAGLILGQCGEGGAGQHVIAIRPGAGTQKPPTAWKVTKAAPYVPMPVIKGGLIFLWGDGGAVSCVRAASGEDVWREKLGGNYFGSPVCAGDKLYCISTKGEVVALAAAEKYQLLGRSPLGEKSHATPAIAGGRMYLRTFSHLISVGGK